MKVEGVQCYVCSWSPADSSKCFSFSISELLTYVNKNELAHKIAWMSALARISASRFGRIAARRAAKRWPSSIKMVNLFPYCLLPTVDLFFMGRLFVGLVDDFSLWILLYTTTDNNSRLFAAGCCDRSIRFLLPQLRCQHVQHNGHLRQRNLKSHHKGMSIDESWRESSFNYMRYSFVLPLVSTGNLQLRFKLLQPKLRRAATTAGRHSLRHFGFAHDPILNTDVRWESLFF